MQLYLVAVADANGVTTRNSGLLADETAESEEPFEWEYLLAMSKGREVKITELQE